MAGYLGVVEAAYRQTGPDRTRPMANVVHYVQQSTDIVPFNIGNAPAFKTALRSAWGGVIAPLQTVDYVMNRVTVTMLNQFWMYPFIPPAPPGTPQKLTPLPTAVYDGDTAGGISGTAMGDALPAYCSYRGRKVTAHPSRRGRGHISIAGVPEPATTEDYLTSADFAAWQNALNVAFGATVTFTDIENTYNMVPCVFSIKQAQMDMAVAAVCSLYCYPLTGTPAVQRVGTMNRRKVRSAVP